MEFSIIIPVYQAENYLKECIDSVIQQSYPNWELLLINDGSTDKSWQICQDYMAKDPRIRGWSKENAGPGLARNEGMQKSHGSYILFLDSDDFFCDINALKQIHERLSKSNADLLMYNVATYWHDSKQLESNAVPIDEKVVDSILFPERFDFFLSKGVIYSGILAKVLRRDLVLEHNLFFQDIPAEDIDWSLRIYQCAAKIDWCDLTIYAYRKQASNTRSSQPYTHDSLATVMNISQQAYRSIEKKDGQYSPSVLSYIAYLYTVWLAQAHLSHDLQLKKDIQAMRPCTCLLNYDKHPGVKKAKLAYRLLGYHNLVRLLAFYMKKTYHLKG